jgi:hypothetical protein
MKKLNSMPIGIFMLFVCVLSVQSIIANDVPLKSDNNPNTIQTPRPSRAPQQVAVRVSLNDYEMSVNFNTAVGVAQIYIEDVNGGIVYQDAIDTNANSQYIFDTYGWDAGVYTLRIIYGSIALKGYFEL